MKYSSLTFSAFIFLNIFIWYWVIAGAPSDVLDVYFLDVGQGDSSLIVLPYGPKVLIDGGPDKSVLAQLDKILTPTDRYIDLLILSHPEMDHFAGFIPVLDRYRIGAFVYNGRDGEIEAWKDLLKILEEKRIPTIVLGAGDKINYRDNDIDILSPDENFVRGELNNTALVAKLDSEGAKLLFTGDIGFKVEEKLIDKYNLDIDVLKVAHHGSKYSSGINFISEATPLFSVIQVGKNRYGHPTKEAIARLAQTGSSIYRNDEDGLVHFKIKDSRLNIFKEK